MGRAWRAGLAMGPEAPTARVHCHGPEGHERAFGTGRPKQM